MEWRRVWLVTTRLDSKDAKVEQLAHTPAELQQLLAAARANPLVWHIRHESKRQLVGEFPEACRNGHRYRSGSLATSAITDWLPCGCGGHHFWRCIWEGCGDERVEPPLAHDCRPSHPARVRRARQR